MAVPRPTEPRKIARPTVRELPVLTTGLISDIRCPFAAGLGQTGQLSEEQRPHPPSGAILQRDRDCCILVAADCDMLARDLDQRAIGDLALQLQVAPVQFTCS